MTAREELASLPLRDRITHVIGATGLTQSEFAGRIGAQTETVNRWANGWSKPNRTFRRKIAELASQAYEEKLDPDLFSDRPTGRQTPLEAAAVQLAETAQDLSVATRALVDLLDEQRELVQRMQRVASVLEQREAAREDLRGSN